MSELDEEKKKNSLELKMMKISGVKRTERE